MQGQYNSQRRVPGNGRRTFFGAALIGFAAAAFVAFAPPSAAQEDGANIWRRGSCATCHGGFADGDGEGEAPDGPNLRKTELDHESLLETVSCGRGEMPYHLKGAFQVVSCYGLPVSDVLPEGFTAGPQFSAEELDVLVDFLFEHVVGVKKTNRKACAAFFGGNMNAPVCAQYPR